MLQKYNVHKLTWACKLLCVKFYISRNTRSAVNLRIRFLGFPRFKSFVRLSIPPKWQLS